MRVFFSSAFWTHSKAAPRGRMTCREFDGFLRGHADELREEAWKIFIRAPLRRVEAKVEMNVSSLLSDKAKRYISTGLLTFAYDPCVNLKLWRLKDFTAYDSWNIRHQICVIRFLWDKARRLRGDIFYIIKKKLIRCRLVVSSLWQYTLFKVIVKKKYFFKKLHFSHW